MQVLESGISYQLGDGDQTKLTFAHRDERTGVLVDGVTVSELIDVIIDRVKSMPDGHRQAEVEKIVAVVQLSGARNAVRCLEKSYPGGKPI